MPGSRADPVDHERQAQHSKIARLDLIETPGVDPV
jgi:hypothetical protein